MKNSSFGCFTRFARFPRAFVHFCSFRCCFRPHNDVKRSGARFSKGPKLFGRISGDLILFVSSKRRGLEARNFAIIISIFILLTTYEKNSFTELAGRSFTNGFSDPKSFSRNGPLAFLKCKWREPWERGWNITLQCYFSVFCAYYSSLLLSLWLQESTTESSCLDLTLWLIKSFMFGFWRWTVHPYVQIRMKNFQVFFLTDVIRRDVKMHAVNGWKRATTPFWYMLTSTDLFL